MAPPVDLSEQRGPVALRHPWETARAEVVLRTLRRLELTRPRVLDIGCGDGFLLHRLCSHLGCAAAVGQDIHLSEQQAQQLSRPGVRFVRQLETIRGARFDLVLLLDVLEHVQEPRELLERVRRAHLAREGRVLISVPAFQSLFSAHDRALHHFRRYSRKQISEVARASGLRVQTSGYWFSSLLLPRALTVLREKVLPRRDPGALGIGSWKAPELATRALHRVLCFDQRISEWTQRAGLVIPGLSAWLLCSEQSS
jgi:SAM-dependent methyltransferase